MVNTRNQVQIILQNGTALANQTLNAWDARLSTYISVKENLGLSNADLVSYLYAKLSTDALAPTINIKNKFILNSTK